MVLKYPCSYKDTAAGHILTRRRSLLLLTCPITGQAAGKVVMYKSLVKRPDR